MQWLSLSGEGTPTSIYKVLIKQSTSQGTADVITDDMAITLVLTVLDNTGVFSPAFEKWRDPTTLTMAAFETHLT
jgi:hypothetical protein